jgi:predicted PurR-regulated permease PerM
MGEDLSFGTVSRAGMVLLAAVGGALAVYALRHLLTPLLAGFLVAYLLHPGLVRLARVGVTRWLSVTLLLLLTLLAAGLALYASGPLLQREVRAIASPVASPAALEQSRLLSRISEFSTQLAAYEIIAAPLSPADVRATVDRWFAPERSLWFGAAGGFVWASVEFLTLFAFALVFGLVDGHRCCRGLLGLLPNAFFEAGVLIVNEAAGIFGSYLRALVVESVIMAAVVLALLLPCCLFTKLTAVLALSVALILALANPVRVIGPLVGTALSVLLVLVFTVDLVALGVALLAAALARGLDDLVLMPVLMRGQLDIHPLTCLLAVAAGGVFGGALGMILAIPVVGCVKAAYRTIVIEMGRFRTAAAAGGGAATG